jgi:hypothetical protein
MMCFFSCFQFDFTSCFLNLCLLKNINKSGGINLYFAKKYIYDNNLEYYCRGSVFTIFPINISNKFQP